MSDCILHLRGEPSEEPSAPDRRAEKRYACARTRLVRLVVRPMLEGHQAVLHDVSIRSVGLLSLTAFEPETVLVVQLPGRRAGSSSVLTAKVRHATALPEGTWLLGCSLSRPLAEEELLALL